MQHDVEVLAAILLLEVELFVLEVQNVADQFLRGQRKSRILRIHPHSIGLLVNHDVTLDVIGVVHTPKWRVQLPSQSWIPGQRQVELRRKHNSARSVIGPEVVP